MCAWYTAVCMVECMHDNVAVYGSMRAHDDYGWMDVMTVAVR